MRNAFTAALLSRTTDQEMVFLTGDLGFNALEDIRDRLGPRFRNCGVAEQNMVSVAAGLAKTGFKPWVYSIAPFCVARPFEQLRNDVCHHGLPVQIVGNGGGYGYGVQGPSHHALEDYAILSTLPGMHIFAPAFAADLEPIINTMCESEHPGYLRLGRDETPQGEILPTYAPWRKLTSGNGPLVTVFGALAGTIWQYCNKMNDDSRPELWCCTALPLTLESLPAELQKSLANRPLIVMEEHVAVGGFGSELIRTCLSNNIHPNAFIHHFAQGYPSGCYGSQAFHRHESELDETGFQRALEKAKGSNE